MKKVCWCLRHKSLVKASLEVWAVCSLLHGHERVTVVRVRSGY